MFDGYYLKINNVTFPNSYMVIPSYNVDDAPIIVADYYDANYGRHIIKAPKTNITISFNLRAMYSSEYAVAMTKFSDTMTIQYYDSKIDGYKTDTFTYNCDMNPQILRQYNNNVLLNEQTITLVRKVAE